MVMRFGPSRRFGRNWGASSSGGVSDVLSYTAPDFKSGHTLPPLTAFNPSFWEGTYSGGVWSAPTDGGLMAQLADDWGYCYELGRGSPSTWETDSFASNIADGGTQTGVRFATINANPGRWKIAAVTRALLSWESTSIAEAIFSGTTAKTYLIGGNLLTVGSTPTLTPGGVIGISGQALTDVFLHDSDGEIIRTAGRALLRPYWCYSAPIGGTSVPSAAAIWAAEELRIVTLMNAQLPVGNKLDVVRNGQEYQPSVRANIALPGWSQNHAYSTLGDFITNDSGKAYKCITTGTSANTPGAGPTGTGSDITDGTVHWKYMAATNTSWRCDPEVDTWLGTIDAYAGNVDADNNAFLDQTFGARTESEQALRDAVNAASPGTLYSYYSSNDIAEGIADVTADASYHLRSYGRRQRSHYGSYWGRNKVFSDYPSPEFYKGYVPTWTSLYGGYVAWVELVTNCAAQHIDAGTPLMYPFIAASTGVEGNIPADDQWMGFLKFIFTLGAVGADVGDYGTYSVTGRAIDSSANNTIRAVVMAGHVQATFSHLENYLRSGTLLEGDYDATGYGGSSHKLSKDLYGRLNGWQHPSYEFAHNDTSQLYSKVVARKLDASNDWLICAWRCLEAGVDKDLSVTIAGHALTVNARRSGTLYHMDNAGTLTILDPLGMDPSRTIATILAGL